MAVIAVSIDSFLILMAKTLMHYNQIFVHIKRGGLSLLCLLSLSLFGSCTKLQSTQSSPVVQSTECRKPVTIYGALLENGLRTSMSSFKKGDLIGVYAYKAGTDADYKGYTNVVYSADANGIFSGVSDGGMVLDEGEADLVAYYPHSAQAKEGSLSIDLKDQKDGLALDLLWARAEANDLLNGYRMPMNFRHMLGLVEVTFAPKDDQHPLPKRLSVRVDNLLTEATFDVKKGIIKSGNSRNTVTIDADENNKVFLFAVPGETITELTLIMDGRKVSYIPDTPLVIESGMRHQLTLRPYLDGVVTTTAYTEIPLVPNSLQAGKVIQVTHQAPDSWFLGGKKGGERRNYTLLFDTEKCVPLFVAYPLYKDCMGDFKRKDNWDFDPLVTPRSLQPVVDKSYGSDSEYNRGHMLASAMRTASGELNATTFYFTNQVPQNTAFNSGTWNQLEENERSWAKSQYDTLFVVAGPIYTNKTLRYEQDNNGKNIAIPDFLYKAIIAKEKGTNEWRSIAVKMPNEKPRISGWSNYVVTIEELEKELGFTFFPNLPADEAKKIKSQRNTSL